MIERPSPEPVVPGVRARPRATRPGPSGSRVPAILGGLLLVGVGALAAALVVLVALHETGNLPGGDAAATRAPGDYALADVRDAPPLDLTDQDGRAFALTSLRGRPVLLFFGYTHCPDVCPTTVGVVTQVLARVGAGPRAVFTSIDPARDDVAAMKSYLRYLDPAFIGLSGTAAQVRTAADAWGVQYAKIETGSAGGYAMAHTADLFLVDARGRLRAKFPFGTDPAPIAAFVRQLLVETPAPPAPAPSASASVPSSSATPAPPGATPSTAPASQAPGTGLVPTIVSSSIWAGGRTPVIMTLADAAGTPLDGTVAVRARVVSTIDGTPAGPDVEAVAVRPPGETVAYYVATLDFPAAGTWLIDLSASTGGTGAVQISVLDPGSTAPLGGPAPDVRTPTLDEVGGVVLAVTTNPQPDLRLSETSTADARAAGKPYVLVIDSARFKVTQACGRALSMIRYQLDRWTDVVFVHLEPFEYSIVTNEPVLNGDIANPPLNRWTRAWGIGDGTWPATDMPWVFVVDGSGVVRAKYRGIVGSADVDVILSLIEGQGVLTGS